MSCLPLAGAAWCPTTFLHNNLCLNRVSRLTRTSVTTDFQERKDLVETLCQPITLVAGLLRPERRACNTLVDHTFFTTFFLFFFFFSFFFND